MTTFVAVFAMVLAYVALVAAYFALRTLAKLRRASAALNRGARGDRRKESLVEAAERQAAATALLGEELAALRTIVDQARDCAEQARTYADQRCDEAIAALKAEAGNEVGALRHVALVRYDAFSEMSGRMSFSLALLDDSGDGVTISAISGSADTRVYAKGVTGGVGEHELSPEEQQAVAAAHKRQRNRLVQRKAS
ncbi:MAG TPA: DUF4446 family protein [Jatrophihabitantaceae bacterium]|jgi:hypothetical protein|nr:DUF4446 family protein [Jatrophihabitantaceae bacterium]